MWAWWFVAACTGSVEDSAEPDSDVVSDEPDTPVSFALPLAEPERFSDVIGVDHDPEDHGDEPLGGLICVDYDGQPFPACYDGHDGTDFQLDGGFEAMDAGSTPVIAAADGVVVEVHDGEYDRCHAEGTGISCDGYPMVGNRVILDHGDGVRTLYWHLKNGSVAVEVGQDVTCGEPLGLVGSSGYSSGPHLHFELQVDDVVVDPYAGPESQPESWWTEQDVGGLPGQQCGDAPVTRASRRGPRTSPSP